MVILTIMANLVEQKHLFRAFFLSNICLFYLLIFQYGILKILKNEYDKTHI